MQKIGLSMNNVDKMTDAHAIFLREISDIFLKKSNGQNINNNAIEDALNKHEASFSQECIDKLEKIKTEYQSFLEEPKMRLDHYGDLTAKQINSLITEKWKQYHSIGDVTDSVWRYGLKKNELNALDENAACVQNKIKQEIDLLYLAQDKISQTLGLFNILKENHPILHKLNMLNVVNKVSKLKDPTLNDLKKIGEEEVGNRSNSKNTSVLDKLVNWLKNIFSVPMDELDSINKDIEDTQKKLNESVEKIKLIKTFFDKNEEDNQNEETQFKNRFN